VDYFGFPLTRLPDGQAIRGNDSRKREIDARNARDIIKLPAIGNLSLDLLAMSK
jgi:hypothetical protein